MITNFTNTTIFNATNITNELINGTGYIQTSPIDVHFWNEDLFLILLLIITFCEVFRLGYMLYTIIMKMFAGGK